MFKNQNNISSDETESSNDDENPVSIHFAKPVKSINKKNASSNSKSKKLSATQSFKVDGFKNLSKLQTERANLIAESFDVNAFGNLQPILDGYSDLLDCLNLDNSDWEVDKVTNYILERNILVQHVNVVLSRITTWGSRVLKRLSILGSIVMGRFTPGELGEDISILN